MDYSRIADTREPVTFEELRETMHRLAGTDFGMHSPRWVSRFGDAALQAERYREGRMLLAGDAAHIHFPAGGQGLNLGVQDAVNLGWKLASVVRGRAPGTLLDSYHAERHPVGARVLHNIRAQSALTRPGPQTDALRDVLRSLIEHDDVNRQLGGTITVLDLRYPVTDTHPPAGWRVPDADPKTGQGSTRLYELLHSARPLLLDLRGGDSTDVATAVEGWADRVDLVEARPAADHWPVWPTGDAPAPRRAPHPPRRPRRLGRLGRRHPRPGRVAHPLTTWFGPAATD